MPQTNVQNEEINQNGGVSWTEDQKRVIDARDRSLLVSAAAGSGKTAVLVERILSLITDPEHPIDVDEILVVTFTKAAAAEMRERLRNALEKAAFNDPHNTHLQRQTSLIHNAQISTIDSFCLQIVTNHFHRISLEPGFRIADEGELRLLKEDAFEAALEDFYKERDPGFLKFLEGYSNAKNDKRIREMIIDLYDYAQSYPWPEEWLDSCTAQYEASSMSEVMQKEWWSSYLDILHNYAEEMVEQCRIDLDMANEEGAPKNYIPALENDLEQAEGLLECETKDEWEAAIKRISFKSFDDKEAEADPTKAKAVQDARKKVKDNKKKIEKELSLDPEYEMDLIDKTGEMVSVLVNLTKAFSERFAQEKAKRNILDFSDEEHFALRILVDPETKEPTETAREYREKYREVMIDEYQDSNYLQEAILVAVSGIPDGKENMFMVGDVKQSIYRFRRACPELFQSKYDSYPKEENPTQRIDLHKNFRSREEILDIVNDLFGRIMGRDMGNIEYNEDTALYKGRDYEDRETTDYRPECILVQREQDRDMQTAEAGVIARRIRRMVEEEELPGISYRDIVVLMRSMKRAQDFVKAFEQEGVPLLVASQTGYFDAQEVQVILSMLRVIDNPRQDIPLATLMHSPIGGFTDEEMSLIRTEDPDAPFYECVLKSACNEKVSRLLDLLEDFRGRMLYTPIHLLIQQIYDETGYRDLASSMPAGEQRRANLDMLIEKAAAYENTSYHGLYHFIRYMDRLIKYSADFGEADVSSENENTVRLMTIHKSKGLEFPVVIVAGMGDNMNLTDASADVILHPSLGVGIKYFDPILRTRTDTPVRRALSFETKREDLGEELRVLYVAMTRAKDKLILVGKEPRYEKKTHPFMEPYSKLNFALRYGAATYWDWVLPALSTYGDTYPLYYEGPAEEETEDALHIVRTAQARSALTGELKNADEDIIADLSERFSWEYPYRQSSLKQKMSVSEIKHLAMDEARDILEDDGGQELYPEKVRDPYVPKFVEEPEENSGALRGTAFHRLMECLDFASVPDDPEDWLGKEIDRLCSSGRLDPKDAERIDTDQAVVFLKDDLAKRMVQAAQKGSLVREQPFVMSVSVDSLPEDLVPAVSEPGESVLIQGIIDAYWEEDDGLVLLDYKTDRIDDEETLVRLYRAQIELYADALSRRFADKRVKEAMIYSFRMDRAIPVDLSDI